MRIALLVNRDVESNVALNLLLPRLRERHQLFIFVSERVGGTAPRARVLGQLGFVEQTLFNELFFPLHDQQSTSRSWQSFDGFERHWNIPVRVLASARTEAALDALREVQADLFISIRFGKILGDEAIAIPPLGVLNLHSGLLPAYRGVLATLRALIAGDEEIGCTLHWIDSPGIDTGKLIASARLPVDRSRSLLWHVLGLYPLGVRLIGDACEQLADNKGLESQAQNPQEGRYFGYPDDADMLEFAARGWRVFDPEDLTELMARYQA